MSIKNLSFQKDSLHHAYLITGDMGKNLDALQVAIKNLVGAELRGHPDYFILKTSNFVVVDSETIIERQKTRSFSGGLRFFVIVAESFTPEAENKLLKVLEEPILGNHFFLVCESEEAFMPTLRSRLFHISGEEAGINEFETFAKKFIKEDVTGRIEMIGKFTKDDEDENTEKKIRLKTKNILDQIEMIISREILEFDGAKQTSNAKFLSELIRVKGYLSDTAPSPRLILEYMAFIL